MDRPPLIKAAYYGRPELCRLLVEHKADLSASCRCPQPSRALLMRVDLTPCAAAHTEGLCYGP
jgi:hypothetical protein